MAIKIGRVVTYGGETPPSKSLNLLITWSREKRYICTSTRPITSKLGRLVTYGRKSPPTKSCHLLTRHHVTNVKRYICMSAIPMATKLGRVVTFSGGTSTKSRDLLIAWSRDK